MRKVLDALAQDAMDEGEESDIEMGEAPPISVATTSKSPKKGNKDKKDKEHKRDKKDKKRKADALDADDTGDAERAARKAAKKAKKAQALADATQGEGGGKDEVWRSFRSFPRDER